MTAASVAGFRLDELVGIIETALLASLHASERAAGRRVTLIEWERSVAQAPTRPA